MDKIRRMILDRIHDRGIDMKHLSEKIGKNETYIQQYLKRGTPRELPDRVRARIAELLGFTDEELGGTLPALHGDVPNLLIHAGMGNGGLEHIETDIHGHIDERHIDGFWSFPPVVKDRMPRLTNIHALPVVGDSMSPTLESGSVVFVDTRHTHPAPEDIYALDYGDGLMIKRLKLVPKTGLVRVISDNERYGSDEMERSDIRVYGRVVGYFRWRG